MLPLGGVFPQLTDLFSCTSASIGFSSTWSTLTSPKLDEITTPIMVFPAVTICNLNSIRFSRITRNDLYHAGELLALLNSRHEIRDAHLVEESVMEVLKSKADFRSFKPRPFNMWDFYNRTGHDIKDMLLSCQFRGWPCRPEDFSVVRHSRDAQ
ncbi:acid-sensing ion channel 1A-like [Cyprinus carpio]|uniref:Acid-sensing ion channel 1A-like n=1 Tax=Cyprinus carpio TaxID=7962 RepID=A0A9Q9ZTS2_CYPCA|nr:acid-sensing ion channel 1A-like [Cyprinus carpio]